MTATDFLDEDEVSGTSIAQTFRRAYLKTELDSEGDVRISADTITVIASLDRDNKLIRFWSMMAIRDNTDDSDILEFVNRVNQRVIFVRFWKPADTSKLVVADYHLPYENGLPRFQVVAAFRLLARVVPAAVQALDNDDIIQ